MAIKVDYGSLSKNCGQERAFVRAYFPGAKIFECRHEPGFSGKLMEQFGDPDAWQYGVELIGLGFGLHRHHGPHRRYLQAVVDKGNAIKLVALQALREFFQPPIQFLATLIQPFIGRRLQSQGRDNRRTAFSGSK
jgi:hypothetical protein